MVGGLRKGVVRVALAALVVAAAAGCHPLASAPSQSPGTGVFGFARSGPTCPVEIPGADCAARPVSGVEVLALDGGGNVVAHTVTDAKGFYSLALAPGTYVIQPEPAQGILGTPQPVTVQVTAGSPLELNLEYDTGIR